MPQVQLSIEDHPQDFDLSKVYIASQALVSSGPACIGSNTRKFSACSRQTVDQILSYRECG